MFDLLAQVHPPSSSPHLASSSSAASVGSISNGSFFPRGRHHISSSSSRSSCTHNGGYRSSVEGGSSDESSFSESSTGSEGSGSDESSSGGESRTTRREEGRRNTHSESSSVGRTAAEDSKSSILRAMPLPHRDTRFVRTLCSAAIVRNTLEKSQQRVEKNVEALQKQFLSRPPLPDTARLDLLGRVNGVVDATNELDRKWSSKGLLLLDAAAAAAAAAADPQTATSRRRKKKETITHVPAEKARSSVDNEGAGVIGNTTALLTPSAKQERDDGSAVACYGEAYIEEGPGLLNGQSTQGGFTAVVTTQKASASQSNSEPLERGGGVRPTTTQGAAEAHTTQGAAEAHTTQGAAEAHTTQGAAEAHNGESSRPPAAAVVALGFSEPLRRRLLSDTDDKSCYDSDGSAKGIQVYEYENDERESLERGREGTLIPSDFIDGFRLMLQPAIDDPLERYIRVRSPDSAVLRLLDYYQQYADLREAWDWERDPSLGSSRDVIYPQTSTLDVEEMLRDAVSLHEQLLKINMGNMRALKRMQNQLVEAWTEADPAVKEAERLFLRSVTGVADAVYTQTQIDDWNLTVLANWALGKREKYLVYDDSTGRLRLHRDAYTAGIIAKEVGSEKLTRELHKKIAALFQTADDRHRMGRHRRREASLEGKDSEKCIKVGPSAATTAGIAARGVTPGTSVKEVTPAAVPADAAGIVALAAAGGGSLGAAVRFVAGPKEEGNPLCTPRQGLLAAAQEAAASTPWEVKAVANVVDRSKQIPTLDQAAPLPSVAVRPPKPEEDQAAAAAAGIPFKPLPAHQQTLGPKTHLQGQATRKAVNGKPVPQVAKLPQSGVALATISKLQPNAVAAPGAGKVKLLSPTSASTAADIAVISRPSATAAVPKQNQNTGIDSCAPAAHQASATTSGSAALPLRTVAPTVGSTGKEMALPSLTTSRTPDSSSLLSPPASKSTTPFAYSPTARAEKRSPLSGKQKLLPKRLAPPPLKKKI